MQNRAKSVSLAITPIVLLAILCAAASLHAVKIYRNLHYDRFPCDFCVYYASAMALRTGLDPYTAELVNIAPPVGAAGGIPHATDPPTYVLAFVPFTYLQPNASFTLWIVLNAAAFLLTLILLLGPVCRISRTWACGLAALAILYPPLGWHFDSSQNKLLLLLLLVVAMRCLENGRDGWAGLALAVAGLVRIFPLLLVGYLLLRRRWRPLLFFGISFLAGTLITIGMIGFGKSLDFLTGAKFLTSRVWLDLDSNASLLALVSRIFWDTGRTGPMANILRQLFCFAAWGLVLATTAFATLMLPIGSKNIQEDENKLYSLWLTVAVLLSPTAFANDLIFLYLPFALIADGALKGTASMRSICAAIGSYILPRNPALLRQLLDLAGLPMIGFPAILGSQFFTLFLGFVAVFWFVIDGPSLVTPGSKLGLVTPHDYSQPRLFS